MLCGLHGVRRNLDWARSGGRASIGLHPLPQTAATPAPAWTPNCGDWPEWALIARKPGRSFSRMGDTGDVSAHFTVTESGRVYLQILQALRSWR